MRIGTGIELRRSPFVFLFAQLLIEDAVLLVPKSRAEDATLAADAITEKQRCTTVLTVLTPFEVVALLHIDTLVTELRFVTVVIVDARLALLYPVAVVAVLGVGGVEHQVAVFFMSCVVSVLRILIIQICIHAAVWRHELEFVYLIEYGSIQIELSSVLQRIKRITPPLLDGIDRTGILRRQLRNKGLPTQC